MRVLLADDHPLFREGLKPVLEKLDRKVELVEAIDYPSAFEVTHRLGRRNGGLDLALLRTITTFATGGLKPDLTIYLDIDVEEGLRRKLAAYQAGEAEWNRMDQQEIAFHRRVREGYLQMAAAEPERWVIIEAAQLEDVAQQAIRAKVEAKLPVPQ